MNDIGPSWLPPIDLFAQGSCHVNYMVQCTVNKLRRTTRNTDYVGSATTTAILRI
ncbi:unnamed protein product [Linum tenue]|uniref:Uncharacterized protein n=1 Tax=Linum tenue TaxID=586396 RepID=A0AAV0REC3_9ROSI|nr:unnamed protein product [Linum tenue]